MGWQMTRNDSYSETEEKEEGQKEKRGEWSFHLKYIYLLFNSNDGVTIKTTPGPSGVLTVFGAR